MKHTRLLLAIAFPLLLLSLFFTTLQTKASPTATFVVNSTVDAVDANPGDGVCETAVAGQCTLRAAVMEANALTGQDTITIPANTYILTITGQEEDAGATGDLDLTDDLVINGADAVLTAIDGALLDRVFHVTNAGSITVSISNLTIQNSGFSDSSDAAEPYGGGIYNALANATVLISDSVLMNNKALGSSFSGRGGAVYNVGSLQISNTDILTNSSPGGHGIYNSGSVLLTGGELAFNTINPAGPGGTVYNDGVLQTNDATFHHNYSYFGGAVHNGPSGTATLKNLNIFSNTVYLDGGGIFNFGSITVTNSTIYANKTNSSSGGGIYNFGGNFLVVDSEIHSNEAEIGFATGGGVYLNGGILEIQNTSIYSNSASTGGGLYANGGAITVTSSIIESNQANSAAGIGLYASSQMTLQNSTIAHNIAITEGGGLLIDTSASAVVTASAIHNNSAAKGGGISNYGHMEGTNLTISSNTAVQEGGGIWHNVLTSSSPYSIILTNVTLVENDAPEGAGIYILNLADISITNTIIAKNGSENCNLPLSGSSFSLEDSNDCGLANISDLTNVDPLLDVLQNNGGDTVTHLLQTGSPAIDAGNNSSCPLTDQRGETRPFDGDDNGTAVCDIGAVELRVEIDTTKYLYLPMVTRP